MAERRVFSLHLQNAEDLITSHEATRAGFVSIALEKNRQASPIIVRARALYEAAMAVASLKALANSSELQPALLTAAGLSDKAISYLTNADKSQAIAALIENFLEPAGDRFAEELVYRYLLVRGDSFGGEMRNIIGAIAQRKLTRALLASLSLSNIKCRWQHSQANIWIESEVSVDEEPFVKSVWWVSRGQDRLLVHNVRVPRVDKNIDLCLLRATGDNEGLKARRVPEAYLALGELKGGIDPAGADEHWKTANTALSRIRSAFADAQTFPATFFVGGAIVNSMAIEVWRQLAAGQLTNAANLTNDIQLASLCRWLVHL